MNTTVKIAIGLGVTLFVCLILGVATAFLTLRFTNNLDVVTNPSTLPPPPVAITSTSPAIIVETATRPDSDTLPPTVTTEPAGCLEVLAPNQKIGNTSTVTVIEERALNVRSQPSTSASVVEILSAGDIVTILDGPLCREEFNWWQLQTANGNTGWSAESSDERYFLTPNE